MSRIFTTENMNNVIKKLNEENITTTVGLQKLQRTIGIVIDGWNLGSLARFCKCMAIAGYIQMLPDGNFKLLKRFKAEKKIEFEKTKLGVLLNGTEQGRIRTDREPLRINDDKKVETDKPNSRNREHSEDPKRDY